MKLHGVIEVHVNGEAIVRQPRFWDKIKKAFGGEPDLRTGKTRAQLEAQVVVDGARQAFSGLGVNNAVTLVIDDHVLYQDKDGKQDDLGDLFLAFHDNASVFGESFRLLRLAVEHAEAGLHYVAEIIARTEHPAREPAARVVISGRVTAFEPKPGESAEDYQARVEPLTKEPARLEAHRLQFEAFVQRVESALKSAMPEAEIALKTAEAQIEKPSTRRNSDRPSPVTRPEDPRYDPYMTHYPSPMDGLLATMMWASFFSMAGVGFGPSVVVVDSDGNDVKDNAAADEEVTGETDFGGGEDAGDVGGDFLDGGGDFGDF